MGGGRGHQDDPADGLIGAPTGGGDGVAVTERKNG